MALHSAATATTNDPRRVSGNCHLYKLYLYLTPSLNLTCVCRLEGDSLVVSSLTEADVGRYQCRAENVAGARESPASTLGVHGESVL